MRGWVWVWVWVWKCRVVMEFGGVDEILEELVRDVG